MLPQQLSQVLSDLQKDFIKIVKSVTLSLWKEKKGRLLAIGLKWFDVKPRALNPNISIGQRIFFKIETNLISFFRTIETQTMVTEDKIFAGCILVNFWLVWS